MKILAISNLHDLMYEDLYFFIISNYKEYDIIVLLGNIDKNILKDIKYILNNKNIRKKIIDIKSAKDKIEIFNYLNIDNISLKKRKINETVFVEMNENNLELDKTKDKEFKYPEVLIAFNNIVEEFYLKGINYIDDLFFKNNQSQYRVCLHNSTNLNTLILMEDIFIIGIDGIAIIDTKSVSINQLY